MDASRNLLDSGITHYNNLGLHLTVVRLLEAVLARRLHVLGRLMVGGRGTVIRLCLGGLGSSGLFEVVRVNFLLSVGLHQERGPSTNCEY